MGDEADCNLKGLTPTRVDKYLYCPRQWAADELLQIKQPGNPQADWGTGFHAVMADYYIDNIRPNKGDKYYEPFQAALRFAPPIIEEGRWVEQTFFWDKIPGTIDLCYLDEGILNIWDWKTTGNLRYAKSVKALLANPQFVIYGLAAMDAFGVSYARMNWLYICRNPNDNGTHDVKPPVSVEVTMGQLKAIYRQEFADAVNEIKSCGGDTDLAKYPRREGHGKGCYRFNRRCHAELECMAAERRESMGTLDQSKLFQEFMAGGGEAPAVNPPQEESASDGALIDACLASELVSRLKALPQDAADTFLRKFGVKRIRDLKAADKAAAQELIEALEVKNGKFPVKFSSGKETKPAAEELEQPISADYKLYLRAMPLDGSDHVLLQELLEPLCEKIAKEHDVAHWNLVPYAQGKAHLAAFLKAVIDEGLLKGKTVVALGHGDELSAVEDVLVRHAGAGSVVGVR